MGEWDDELAIFGSEYLPNAEKATVTYARWRKQEPGEYALWVAFRDTVLAGGEAEPPSLSTRKGRELVAAAKLHMSLSRALGTITPPGAVPSILSPPTILFEVSHNDGVLNGDTLTGVLGEWTGSPTLFGVTVAAYDSTGTTRQNTLDGPYTVVPGGEIRPFVVTTNSPNTVRLEVLASNATGSRLELSAAVPVEQTPSPYSVSQSIANAATLSGSFEWSATPTNVTTTEKIEFYVDGVLRWTENLAPYIYNGDGSVLDTTTLSNASHTFQVRAYVLGSVADTDIVTATVNNTLPPPPPPPPDVGNHYMSPWLFDKQDATEIGAPESGFGWTGKFLTTGSNWTKIQNSGFWPASVWVRRHTIADAHSLDSQQAERDRCFASFNGFNIDMDNGSDSGPGVTIWDYCEFVIPVGFQFASGSWNFMAMNWHHTGGINSSIGQTPFRIGATNAGGTRHLFCNVRGGLQISSSNAGSDAPNTEDFQLDSPFKFGHVYRILLRRTLAPNGTPPFRNQYISVSQPGQYIVPLSTGNSHGIFEIWVDDVLKVSKRRPTSYYDLSQYTRSGMDRNSEGVNFPTQTFWETKRTVARTRAELFQTIRPVTTDTFAAGG